jgi:hypothetical protein
MQKSTIPEPFEPIFQFKELRIYPFPIINVFSEKNIEKYIYIEENLHILPLFEKKKYLLSLGLNELL